jgi:hypothetical protein
MPAQDQNRTNEEHRPNDRFVTRKRPLAKDTMNGRLWPKIALRRHRNNDRLCHSHEGPESTQGGHSI